MEMRQVPALTTLARMYWADYETVKAWGAENGYTVAQVLNMLVTHNLARPTEPAKDGKA